MPIRGRRAVWHPAGTPGPAPPVDSRRVVPRALLAIAAVAVAAWLAIALRSSDLQRDALAIALTPSGRLAPAALARARGELRRSRTGMPDELALTLEGVLLQRERRPAQAAAVFERLVRLEPENAIAWLGLARTAPDARRRAQARAAIRRLVPPVSRSDAR